jgi:hypothetical protein
MVEPSTAKIIPNYNPVKEATISNSGWRKTPSVELSQDESLASPTPISHRQSPDPYRHETPAVLHGTDTITHRNVIDPISRRPSLNSEFISGQEGQIPQD